MTLASPRAAEDTATRGRAAPSRLRAFGRAAASRAGRADGPPARLIHTLEDQPDVLAVRGRGDRDEVRRPGRSDRPDVSARNSSGSQREPSAPGHVLPQRGPSSSRSLPMSASAADRRMHVRPTRRSLRRRPVAAEVGRDREVALAAVLGEPGSRTRVERIELLCLPGRRKRSRLRSRATASASGWYVADCHVSK